MIGSRSLNLSGVVSMGIKYIIMMLGIILALSGAEALKFDETIAVKGNGDLYTRTDIPYAKDLAQGIGTQNYSMAFGVQSPFSGSFRSKYALKGANDDESDRHQVNINRDNSERSWTLCRSHETIVIW